MTIQRTLDIIIPSYNRPKRLFNLLKTGLELEMEGVYFVVIDDGSDLVEYIEGIGSLSTADVCNYFQHSAIIYVRNPTNIGLARSWVRYYDNHCEAKYTLSVVDKDFFLDRQPIMNALQKLEQDDSLCMVVIPLMQEDRVNKDLLIGFDYAPMTGRAFVAHFINDTNLQHCTSYGIKRVSCLKKASLPMNLNLRRYGLDDGFGIDIDLVLRLAPMGNVAFESKPHVKRILMEGATEKYPLTFAYTYYQYAKHAIRQLKASQMIEPQDAQHYIKNWLLLILRGLVVAYQPVHGSEMEQGTARIRKHLKMPIHLYLIKELFLHRIKLSEEMRKLYLLSMHLTFNALRK